jgi:uncharacterized protein YndB with AHSA1/START domain
VTAVVAQSVRIRAPLARVWAALVDPTQIEQWLNGAHIETTWQVGSPITFSGTLEGMTYRDKGTVLQFEPRRIMQYTHWSKWSRLPDTPDNYSAITITVEPAREGTLLAVRHEHFVTDEMYNHAKLHWQTTLPVLKEMVEAEHA